MSVAPAPLSAGETRSLAFDVLQATSDALISVVDYMIADWGRPDETAKKQAIDALLAKLGNITELKKKLIDGARPNESDINGA